VAFSRAARFVFGFIGFTVLASLGAVVVIVTLATAGPTIEPRSVLWLRLPSNLTEYVPESLLGQLIAGRRDTVNSVVEALRKAKVDERIEAVVVIPSPQLGMWGKVQEVREAILDFKESGKPIIAYLEYGGSQQYYLATAADKIFLTPTSSVDLVGVASYELFLRKALDTVGVYPDMLHAGDFKTASNIYTETTFTAEHKEMAEALNRDLYQQLVSGIAEGRRLTEGEVRRLIDNGPYLPDDAVEQSLVDGLRYEDELLGQDPLPEEGLHRLLYQDYRLVDPRPLGLNQGPEIAVIYAVGTITFGASGVDVSGSEVLGSEAIVAAVREAREDPTVEAIIVRIDSPGGAAVASDIIWRELALAREAKPVIASMSDLAASGGYYIAAPADVVVAQPGTLTGSIGVVAGKFVIGGTLDKLGINVESVTNGRSAAFNSVFLPFSEDLRVRLQQQIDATYETFLLRVAEGREMSRDDVHAVAQGRVWTGRQARENGLVDELGGFRRAVEIAKDRAGIATDLEVTLVPYPKPPSLLEMLSEGVGGPVAVARRSLSGSEKLQAIATLPFRLFRPSQPLALMPGWIPMLLNY
tara:strand:- start:19299 stop:21050 length:1752 start_codon:yes stop_codon:yes gene_type:complete